MIRTILGYWAAHDADLWVNQRLLVTHVRSALRRADKDTVRSVLHDLVQEGLLVARRLTARRLVYRLSPRFADPVAPGYSREVDELLLDPITWVNAEGRFFRIGRGDGNRRSVYPVATFPHHFAKHAWMRSWIHTQDRGRLVPGPEGLRTVGSIARRAPLDLLWEFWLQRNRHDVIGAAGRAFETTRLWRATRKVAALQPALASPGPEEAFRVLHGLCDHSHLRPVLGPPLVRMAPPFLPPRLVYRGLDACIRRLVDGSDAPLALEGLLSRCREVDPLAEVDDPLLPRIEPTIRGLGAELRTAYADHSWTSPADPPPAAPMES